MKTTFWALAVCVSALGIGYLSAGRALATTLTLDTGKAATVNPGSSTTFTFSATNDAGAITDNFLGWTLGIQVVPSGLTTGTLSLGALTQPSSNPMPTGGVDITQPTLSTLALSGTINGSTQYYLTGATALDALGTVASLGSVNLGSLSVSASPNASGVWNVYAVQQGGSFYKSYWTDGGQNDVDFGNLPRGSSGSNTSVLIGTVSAVPEPGTLALLSAGIASIGWYGLRRRKSASMASAI